MNFEAFKNAMTELLRTVVRKGDAKGESDKAKIEKLSADLTIANQTIAQLQAAIAAKDEATTAALAAQSADLLGQLDTLSSELAAEFNPTSTADAVAEAVSETPEIVTPDEVEEATTIGTNEVTPPEVVEAAIIAVEDVMDED